MYCEDLQILFLNTNKLYHFLSLRKFSVDRTEVLGNWYEIFENGKWLFYWYSIKFVIIKTHKSVTRQMRKCFKQTLKNTLTECPCKVRISLSECKILINFLIFYKEFCTWAGEKFQNQTRKLTKLFRNNRAL